MLFVLTKFVLTGVFGQAWRYPFPSCRRPCINNRLEYHNIYYFTVNYIIMKSK